MKATFAGQDYTLMLDKEKRELQRLPDEILEAPLTEHWGDKDLGKLVTLELNDTNRSDGIELRYFPEDAESWEAIQKVQVKINERARNNLITMGRIGTRYNGSDKIDIYDGDPRFDFD